MNAVRAIILAAALAHQQDPALLDRIAWCEDRYNPTNLYQLTPSGKQSDFARWETAQGFTDHRLNDPSRQANFVADRIGDGELSAWNASRQCWGYLVEGA